MVVHHPPFPLPLPFLIQTPEGGVPAAQYGTSLQEAEDNGTYYLYSERYPAQPSTVACRFRTRAHGLDLDLECPPPGKASARRVLGTSSTCWAGPALWLAVADRESDETAPKTDMGPDRRGTGKEKIILKKRPSACDSVASQMSMCPFLLYSTYIHTE